MKLEELKKYCVTYVTNNQKQEIILYGNSEKEVIANVITFFVSIWKDINRDLIKASEIKDEKKDECN